MCGIFGACSRAADARRASPRSALFSLQHRGQESAGVAVSDGEQLMLYKDLGLIAQVLDERRLPSLRGSLAIAHCRYSTTGSTVWENAQPTFRLGPRRALAIGHNGNLVNTRELLGAARGGKPRLPAIDGHGAPDRAPRATILAADIVDALQARPADRPGRLLAGHPRRAARHRRARSVRLPAARAGPARAAPTDDPEGEDIRAAGSSAPRRRPSTSPARSTCATSSRARSSSSKRAGEPRLRPLRRRPRAARASSS